jgi:hypothetical protein
MTLESDRERGTSFHLHLPMDARPFQADAAARGP